MRLENFDATAAISYDHHVFDELFSLRFVDTAANALIMGPVGTGKTFIATALGHAAVRRRATVHFERADRLLKRLKAARLDNSHDTEMRKLLRTDLLILDDFCLQPMDAADTAAIYEIIVERHRTAATITTSNREPVEWLALMADGLLAQSAIDRLQSAAWELILDGESYRHRQRPAIKARPPPPANPGDSALPGAARLSPSASCRLHVVRPRYAPGAPRGPGSRRTAIRQQSPERTPPQRPARLTTAQHRHIIS